MKTISLLAAVALAASSVRGELMVGFSPDTNCATIVDHRDFSDSAGVGLNKGSCIPVLSDAYHGIEITDCTGHVRCQCELFTDGDCKSSFTAIEYDPQTGNQFCYPDAPVIKAIKCSYLDF